jgi:hypothetical protein
MTSSSQPGPFGHDPARVGPNPSAHSAGITPDPVGTGGSIRPAYSARGGLRSNPRAEWLADEPSPDDKCEHLLILTIEEAAALISTDIEHTAERARLCSALLELLHAHDQEPHR